MNGLAEGTIELLEADFITYKSPKKYDVVLSAGFIEHFLDTKHIISQHLDMLKPGGQLFISMPNFLGVNGLMQKSFDKENLAIHNLKAMDITHLTSICNELGVKNLQIRYYGKSSVWLEKTAKTSNFNKSIVKYLDKALHFVPFSGKFFSPFIVITGTI